MRHFLCRILYRLRDVAFDRSKIALFATPLAFNAPDGGVPLGPWDNLHKILRGGQRMAKVHIGKEILPQS